jgi:hypothetical protein
LAPPAIRCRSTTNAVTQGLSLSISAAVPAITQISPATGLVGEQVTITRAVFGATLGTAQRHANSMFSDRNLPNPSR